MSDHQKQRTMISHLANQLAATALFSQVRRKRSRAANAQKETVLAVERLLLDMATPRAEDFEVAAPGFRRANQMDDALAAGKITLDMLDISDFIGRDPETHWQVKRSTVVLFEEQILQAENIVVQILNVIAPELVIEFALAHILERNNATGG